MHRVRFQVNNNSQYYETSATELLNLMRDRIRINIVQSHLDDQ